MGRTSATMRAMGKWQAPHWLMVLGATFFGAAVAYVKTAILVGIPQSVTEWEQLLVSALAAGAVASMAIYVTPPGKISIKVPFETEPTKASPPTSNTGV